MNIAIGQYNFLEIERFVEFGAYLNDGAKGILLPNRWLPPNSKIGDVVKVFVSNDSEDRLIATTETPKATVGQIAFLQVVSVTKSGAFLNWGLMKDVFVAHSQQIQPMEVDQYYFVQLYVDANSNRIAATQWFEKKLQENTIALKELDAVELMVYRKTNLGFAVIINHSHIGLLHQSDVFKTLAIGSTHNGYIKKIFTETGKIDVMLGKVGFEKVSTESNLIVDALKANNGFLPYTDKTSPEIIYEKFGVSKKTFKMMLGNLYKQRTIQILPNGIQLL
jgi:uncharacterized protein